MAVPNIPFYFSQAAAEYGLPLPTNAQAIRTAAGLPATGMMSDLAGRSAITRVDGLTQSITCRIANSYSWIHVSEAGSVWQHYNGQIGTTERYYNKKIFTGIPWCRIITSSGAVGYSNCSPSTWFLPDTTMRGAYNYTAGTSVQALYQFSNTNGGAVIYELLLTLTR